MEDVEKLSLDSLSIYSPKIWVWVPLRDLGLWPEGSAGAPDISKLTGIFPKPNYSKLPVSPSPNVPV